MLHYTKSGNLQFFSDKLKEYIVPLFRNHNALRISASDWINGFVVSKLKAGENISLDVEADADFGEQIVISSNKSAGRSVLIVNSDTVIEPNVYLVVADASQNSVKLTLPVAHDYTGQLSIVCADPSHGVEFIPNTTTQNVIFDTTNIQFHAKGDAIVLVSDRGQSDPLPPTEDDSVEAQGVTAPVLLTPGTWYIVGKYNAQWYA